MASTFFTGLEWSHEVSAIVSWKVSLTQPIQQTRTEWRSTDLKVGDGRISAK